MKPLASDTLYGRNGAIPHPTYSIFLDSPCISFDSPVCLPVQLFWRSRGHTRFFPKNCEASALLRPTSQPGGPRHHHCLEGWSHCAEKNTVLDDHIVSTGACSAQQAHLPFFSEPLF